MRKFPRPIIQYIICQVEKLRTYVYTGAWQRQTGSQVYVNGTLQRPSPSRVFCHFERLLWRTDHGFVREMISSSRIRMRHLPAILFLQL